MTIITFVSFPLTPNLYLYYQKVLAAHGATKVSAYVTHAVFPKHSWGRFVHKDNGNHLDKLIHIAVSYPLYTSTYIYICDFFLQHFVIRKLGQGICLLLDH